MLVHNRSWWLAAAEELHLYLLPILVKLLIFISKCVSRKKKKKMQKNNMSQKQNKCISQELFKFLIKSLDFFFLE